VPRLLDQALAEKVSESPCGNEALAGAGNVSNDPFK
jgi:hypothetical protein